MVLYLESKIPFWIQYFNIQPLLKSFIYDIGEQNMAVEEIRQIVKEFCEKINESEVKKKPIISVPRGATGSAAGLPFEKWFQKAISDKIKYEVFGRLDFMNYILENYNISLDILLKTTWWGGFQQFTPENIRRVKKGEKPKLQQTLGDIIIKYGNDLNDIILINVKATEVSNGEPVGRPPNIISAYRLLRFFLELFNNKPHLIKKVNVWLVGFDYNPLEEEKVRIRQCHFKNLFWLDLDKAPPINFDAAIQIQWHLRDMIECEEQTVEDFAQKLAYKYRAEWKAFVNQRNEKLERFVEKLLSLIRENLLKRRMLINK
jgi:hypothetical protein